MNTFLHFSNMLKVFICFSVLIVLSILGLTAPAAAVAAGTPPMQAQPGQALSPRGLGPEFQISDTYLTGIGVDHYLPDVAYNTYRKEFLVVWHQLVASNPEIRNIYAQRVSLDGLLIGPIIQVSIGDTDARPAVAYDVFNDDYLVVWQHELVSDNGRNEIWGRLISWNGSGVTGSFPVFTWPGQSLESPKVAYYSSAPNNAFLVIWNSFSMSSLWYPTDISGVHVSPSGIPDAAAHNFAVNGATIDYGSHKSTLYAPQQANLVYNDMISNYLIVFQGFENDSPDWHVFGQVAYPNGSLGGYWFFIASLHYPGNGQNPAVASGGDYGNLVAWSQENSPGPSVTEVQMYDQHEQKVGVPVLSDQQFGNQAFPAVAGNRKGRFVVARQVESAAGQQIWAMQCYNASDGAHCNYSFPVEDFAFWDGKHPAIANGGTDYNTFLIVYEETAPGDPSVHQRIFGRIFSAYQWTFLPTIRR